MLWANLIRVNISGLILFLELASGVTGSPTSCSQPYEGVTPQFTHRSGESPAPSSKWQVPSGGKVGRRASHAHSLLGLAALLLVCDKGWESSQGFRPHGQPQACVGLPLAGGV